MVNDLLLLSGLDIPFPQAQITIHQPKIKEIALIGEEAFFLGSQTLNFSKDLLNPEDKISLENKTNFEVLMSIMRDKNFATQQNKVNVELILTLIFPNHKIHFNKTCIDVVEEGDWSKIHKIDNSNFEVFKEIIVDMFCLKNNDGNSPSYNPSSPKAAEIAAKLKKGRELAARTKGEHQKMSIINRYMSILSIGNKQSLNDLNEYTVYQLFDAFKRLEMKNNFDMYIQMRIAGAKDLDEVDNWMKDIHS